MMWKHLMWLPVTLLLLAIVALADQFTRIAAFLKDFQTLLAGLLAIAAAYIAYSAVLVQVKQREKELDENAKQDRERRLKSLSAFLAVLKEDVGALLQDITDQRNCVEMFRIEDGMTTDQIERFFKSISPRIGRSLVSQWENSDLVERPEILQRIERLNNVLNHLDDGLSWTKNEIVDVNKEVATGGSKDIKEILGFYLRTADYCLDVIGELNQGLTGFADDISSRGVGAISLRAT